LKSYVRPGWFSTCLTILLFQLILQVFSTTLHTQLNFPHPLNLGLSHCICVNLWTLWGFIFFVVPMVEKKIVSHDVVHDAFVFIARNVRFHILHKHIHVRLSLTLQSTCQQVNIGVLVDGIRMSNNIIITNPI
jgi:hypothetical protein